MKSAVLPLFLLSASSALEVRAQTMPVEVENVHVFDLMPLDTMTTIVQEKRVPALEVRAETTHPYKANHYVKLYNVMGDTTLQVEVIAGDYNQDGRIGASDEIVNEILSVPANFPLKQSVNIRHYVFNPQTSENIELLETPSDVYNLTGKHRTNFDNALHRVIQVAEDKRNLPKSVPALKP